MWLFDYFKKKREAKRAPKRGPTLQEMRGTNADYTRPIPLPPKGQYRSLAPESEDPSIIWAPIFVADTPQREGVLVDPLVGAGGTFDGGGASGNWSDSRGCSAPDTSSSSNYSPSDSGSSCDSGSSSYE